MQWSIRVWFENLPDMLETGVKGRQERMVTEESTATHLKSGPVTVYATAMMIALMEKTCMSSVEPFLADGSQTVGTLVNVSHVSATPVGMRVWCESELVEVDGRRLVFRVSAYDETGLIGEGTHERFVIETERFLAKTRAKLSQY